MPLWSLFRGPAQSPVHQDSGADVDAIKAKGDDDWELIDAVAEETVFTSQPTTDAFESIEIIANASPAAENGVQMVDMTTKALGLDVHSQDSSKQFDTMNNEHLVPDITKSSESEIVDVEFECQTCFVKYTSNMDLNIHLRTLYGCTVCRRHSPPSKYKRAKGGKLVWNCGTCNLKNLPKQTMAAHLKQYASTCNSCMRHDPAP